MGRSITAKKQVNSNQLFLTCKLRRTHSQITYSEWPALKVGFSVALPGACFKNGFWASRFSLIGWSRRFHLGFSAAI
jgi:hypothetical protein